MKTIDRETPPAPARDRSRRRLFTAARLRWAVAAALAVCIVLGVNILDRDGTGGLVWADVLARVVEAQDFVCRRIEKRRGEPAQEIVEYRSERYGLRQDIYQDGELQAVQYIVPAENMGYALIHRDRTYMQQRYSDEQIAELRRQTNAREMVASFRETEYRKLGRRRIDGKLAEGIEITDLPELSSLFEKSRCRLWVDVETEWPILLELEVEGHGGAFHKTYTLEDFQWNARFTPRDFAFEIPDGYELIADLGEVEATEEKAVDGLRAYAGLMAGHYPGVLSFATALAESVERLDDRHDRYDAAAGKDVAALFAIRSTCNFYRDMQAADRDPAYHGDTVTARDFDRVLLRWRLDDGRYRVVYGDLRVETVSAERLVELEELD